MWRLTMHIPWYPLGNVQSVLNSMFTNMCYYFFFLLISFSTIQFAIGISKHILQTSIWLLKFTINITECLHTEYLARTNMTLQENVAFFFHIFFFKYLMKYTYYQFKFEQNENKIFLFLYLISKRAVKCVVHLKSVKVRIRVR